MVFVNSVAAAIGAHYSRASALAGRSGYRGHKSQPATALPARDRQAL